VLIGTQKAVAIAVRMAEASKRITTLKNDWLKRIVNGRIINDLIQISKKESINWNPSADSPFGAYFRDISVCSCPMPPESRANPVPGQNAIRPVSIGIAGFRIYLQSMLKSLKPLIQVIIDYDVTRFAGRVDGADFDDSSVG